MYSYYLVKIRRIRVFSDLLNITLVFGLCPLKGITIDFEKHAYLHFFMRMTDTTLVSYFSALNRSQKLISLAQHTVFIKSL